MHLVLRIQISVLIIRFVGQELRVVCIELGKSIVLGECDILQGLSGNITFHGKVPSRSQVKTSENYCQKDRIIFGRVKNCWISTVFLWVIFCFQNKCSCRSRPSRDILLFSLLPHFDIFRSKDSLYIVVKTVLCVGIRIESSCRTA